MSEMSLSMREPSVAPRGADVVGSLKVCRGGTAVGETREEGGSFILFIESQLFIINYSLLIINLISVFTFSSFSYKLYKCTDSRANAYRGQL